MVWCPLASKWTIASTHNNKSSHPGITQSCKIKNLMFFLFCIPIFILLCTSLFGFWPLINLFIFTACLCSFFLLILKRQQPCIQVPCAWAATFPTDTNDSNLQTLGGRKCCLKELFLVTTCMENNILRGYLLSGSALSPQTIFCLTFSFTVHRNTHLQCIPHVHLQCPFIRLSKKHPLAFPQTL